MLTVVSVLLQALELNQHSSRRYLLLGTSAQHLPTYIASTRCDNLSVINLAVALSPPVRHIYSFLSYFSPGLMLGVLLLCH
jgi:hypothetical protein